MRPLHRAKTRASGKRLLARCALGGLLLITHDLPADSGPDAARLWQRLTALDVDAAHALLRDDHPAAVPAVSDSGFIDALQDGYARALERAAQVSSFEGYVATLGEFARRMGDGHIWFNPRFVPKDVRWAGIVAARQGPGWIVAVDDPTITGVELQGARIAECDGRKSDALARDVLHYLTNVDVPAMLSIYGGWLLIDQGNPFMSRPKSCTFERNGQQVVVDLNWKRIARSELLEHHWHRAYGAAGFGVRPSGAGYWLALQELTPRAQAVIDAVAREAAQIRAAQYVVVDVRGNGGGDDHYARLLAEQLYGEAYVSAVLGPENSAAGGCDEVYRASAGNLDSLLADAGRLRDDPAAASGYHKAAEAIRAALAKGQAMAGDLSCRARAPPAGKRPAPLEHNPVFILTDAACFSSCLQAVQFFRRLGAQQIGQETGADTHYAEVREIVLPSGLGTFSTLRAIMPDYPPAIGPFSPVLGYEGDIADTAALERWTSGLTQR